MIDLRNDFGQQVINSTAALQLSSAIGRSQGYTMARKSGSNDSLETHVRVCEQQRAYGSVEDGICGRTREWGDGHGNQEDGDCPLKGPVVVAMDRVRTWNGYGIVR